MYVSIWILILSVILILFFGSGFWPSFVNTSVFKPVALLNSNTLLIELNIEVWQYAVIVSIIEVLLLVFFMGFLIFILFPYTYKLGPKGIFGAVIVFFITFIAGKLVEFLVENTINLTIEPLGLLSPVIAAAIHKIVSNRYAKILDKFFSKS
jgi:hypothetical protein